jgi:2-dehydropantoate 2-reductase
MTILVIGAGATGGYFGGRLAQAGRDVTFLVRPARAGQLRERGLRIVGQDGDQVVAAHLVTAGQLAGHADVVLVSVKATGLQPAIADFAPAVGPRTLVIPFLNGMGHLAALNDRFGEQAVLGGVVIVATQLNDEGDIVVLAPQASLRIGAQDGGRTALLQATRDQLAVPGYELSVSDGIVADMWHKWVFIATVGALTCLMRGTVGDIVAVPGGRGLGPAILAEASAVAAAAGYPVPDAATAANTKAITADGSPLTSSMSRDLADGRPTEVEPVLADLASRGAALGVPVPLLDLATMHLRVYNSRLAGH